MIYDLNFYFLCQLLYFVCEVVILTLAHPELICDVQVRSNNMSFLFEGS